MNRLYFLVATLFLFTGCRAIQPAFMLEEEGGSLYKHSTNTIYLDPSDEVTLDLEHAYFPHLPETTEGRGNTVAERYEGEVNREAIRNGIGNRELLIYAEIYDNGKSTPSGNVVVSDFVSHVTSHEFATITNPRFFSRRVQGNTYYQIVISVFEIDTIALMRMMRRNAEFDYESMSGAYSGGYDFGGSFANGFGNVVTGIMGMATSLTGQHLEVLVAQTNAEKILEHSIYFVPSNAKEETVKDKGILVVLGDDKKGSVMIETPEDPDGEPASEPRFLDGNEDYEADEGAGNNRLPNYPLDELPNYPLDEFLRALENKSGGNGGDPDVIRRLLYQNAFDHPFMILEAHVRDTPKNQN